MDGGNRKNWVIHNQNGSLKKKYDKLMILNIFTAYSSCQISVYDSTANLQCYAVCGVTALMHTVEMWKFNSLKNAVPKENPV